MGEGGRGGGQKSCLNKNPGMITSFVKNLALQRPEVVAVYSGGGGGEEISGALREKP